jgi:hypothetical protein
LDNSVEIGLCDSGGRANAEFLLGAQPVFFGTAALTAAGFPVGVRKCGNFFIARRIDGSRGIGLRRYDLRLGSSGREYFDRLRRGLSARSRGSLSARGSSGSARGHHEIVFGRTLPGHVVVLVLPNVNKASYPFYPIIFYPEIKTFNAGNNPQRSSVLFKTVLSWYCREEGGCETHPPTRDLVGAVD